MRDSRKNYLVVGIFLLAMLGALVAWLAVLSGRTGATNPYYIEFENVMGLTEGALILYEGYPVGQIEEIVLARRPDASAYRLDVSIREGWEIPEDSTAVITQAGFLSAVVVDIQAGLSTRMLTPGDRIPSLGATNILTAMSSVANKIGELTDTSLKPLLDNLTAGTEPLKTLFKDAPVMIENLKRFTMEINDLTDRLNTLLDHSEGRVETILADFETASGNVASLTTDLRQTNKRIDRIFEDTPAIMENLKRFTVEINNTTVGLNTLLDQSGGRVGTILADFETASGNIAILTTDLRQTRKRLDTLLVSTNTLVSKNREDIDHSIEDLRLTLEVVASHVREITYNLEATTRNMNEFTAEIRRDPGLILRGRGFDEDLENENK